jgi:hypothetical protein
MPGQPSLASPRGCSKAKWATTFLHTWSTSLSRAKTKKITWPTSQRCSLICGTHDFVSTSRSASSEFARENTWLPGVAPRDRGQPNQDPSDHQHDTLTFSQGSPVTDRQTGRLEQIHFQIRIMKSTLSQDTARRKRLRVGTRAGGSLRVTQATPVKLGNSCQPRSLAASATLHCSLAMCSQRSASPGARQRGHDLAMPSLLRL